MSWLDIKERYGDLVQARDAKNGKNAAQAWNAFCEAATTGESPFHLATLLEQLDAVRRDFPDTPQSELTILDHGCGGAVTLLYLLANGYRGVVGVDVGGPLVRWNDLLIGLGAIDYPGFFVYDGRTLPLPDESVHLVFSQQVLEHVAPDVIEAYYAEEGRVLKPKGRAYHQVPHRLVPYESHSRTWFIHYLPRPAAQWMYRRLGRASVTLVDHLFLRSPQYHRRAMQRHVGDYRDITALRISRPIDCRYYDGPIRLREMIGRLVRAPIVGDLFKRVLGQLMMLDTVSIKPLSRE